MNREGSWGTLSGSDSDTIAGESLIKSKHIRTMKTGCVTARPSLHWPCLAVSIPTSILAPILPPLLSCLLSLHRPPTKAQCPQALVSVETSSSTAYTVVHRRWQQAVRRSQAIERRPCQGGHFPTTIQCHSRAPKLPTRRDPRRNT